MEAASPRPAPAAHTHWLTQRSIGDWLFAIATVFGAGIAYASDVVITDNRSKEVFEHTIKVDKPFEHRGIALYQANCDRGSLLKFTVHGMTTSEDSAFPIEIEVGAGIPLDSTGGHTLEITGFSPVNVEDLTTPDKEPNHTSLLDNGSRGAENVRDLGPLYTFILRNPAGQAREYINYMNPVMIAGRPYLVSGVRTSQTDDVSWLRIPLDDDGSVDTWFSIRQSFFVPERRAALIERFISHTSKKEEKKSLKTVAEHVLTLFTKGGLEAIEHFSETNVPEDKREEANMVFIQALQNLAWEAWMMAREAAGKSVLEPNEYHAPYIRDVFFALTASLRYGAPFYLQLTGYE